MQYYPAPETAIEIPELIEAVREAFVAHGNGDCQMPPKNYVTLPGGDFRTMPSFLPGLNLAGVKIVNVHPHNREAGLPTVMALTIILDPPTGKPVAILNATSLTDLRTGASAAVATAALAEGKKGSVGIIGAGRQARAGLRAIDAVYEISRVRIWSRKTSHAEKMAAEFPGLDVSVTSLEQTADADIILTTTPSKEPLIKDDWIRSGTHINAIGADAPGKQELDPRVLTRAQVFVDDREQAIHSGEVNVPISRGLYSPEAISGTLGEVLTGKAKRTSPDAITIFDSTGIAITDLAVASLAMKSGNAINLPFL